MAGFDRNGWPTSVGIGGRIASESVAGLHRITHPKGKPPKGVLNRSPVLPPERSAELLDRLLGELASQEAGDDLLAWARTSLPLKNTLLEADARMLEAAYQKRLEDAALPDASVPEQGLPLAVNSSPIDRTPAEQIGEAGRVADVPQQNEAGLSFPKEPPRKRSKIHIAFVRGQACLICKTSPSDAHHLKFAQPRALGRKVSDEFTVPLCRLHHQDLHRHGNEKAWWTNMQISPLPIAKELWDASPTHQVKDSAMTASTQHQWESPSE